MATVAEIVRKIRRYTDCYMIREGSNHEIWLNPDTGEQFTIPRHYSKDVKPGTADSIFRKSGLK